MQLFFCQHH